jgi:hypothetical protein
MPSVALVSQRDAARYLGVSQWKVGMLVSGGYLMGPGHEVTAGSLQIEKEWRATAARGQKIKRRLRGVLTWITF